MVTVVLPCNTRKPNMCSMKESREWKPFRQGWETTPWTWNKPENKHDNMTMVFQIMSDDIHAHPRNQENRRPQSASHWYDLQPTASLTGMDPTEHATKTAPPASRVVAPTPQKGATNSFTHTVACQHKQRKHCDESICDPPLLSPAIRHPRHWSPRPA